MSDEAQKLLVEELAACGMSAQDIEHIENVRYLRSLTEKQLAELWADIRATYPAHFLKAYLEGEFVNKALDGSSEVRDAGMGYTTHVLHTEEAIVGAPSLGLGVQRLWQWMSKTDRAYVTNAVRRAQRKKQIAEDKARNKGEQQ